MNEENLKHWINNFENYLGKQSFDDGSHDISHFRRVWRLAQRLSSRDDDKLVILAACYFHDIVSYPKNDPRRSRSSKDAASKTRDILTEMNFPEEKLDNVCHCIESHSYSANIETKTHEAKIVQDADRMESLGAIGLARTFYVAGRMGSQIFSSTDPFAKDRELDDSKFAIDHFKTKLLKLPDTMKTVEGKKEAIKRARILEVYLEQWREEL